MESRLPVHIGSAAISKLVRYCRDNQMNQLTLVADQNTYAALGEAVEHALGEREFDVNTIVLTGGEIIADEHYIVQVLLQADQKERVYIAVGSGTITDITRFVSHRTKSPFISVPTAPSVDGFTSIGAPLVIGRLKQTLVTQPPVAVFADVPTLCAAPHRLIASGFGDIVGKFTSIADWRLGNLLWDEPYDAAIAHRARQAAQACASHAGGIGKATEQGIRCLMDGLIESGFCMLAFGNTNPASGAEHHVSHYWEMKLLWENKPAILHGEKVGVACILIARYYDQIRQMSQRQAADCLDHTSLPDREQEIGRIRAAYGPIAETLIEEQAPFLDMSGNAYDSLKQKIVDNWSHIQAVAAAVPSAEDLTSMLKTAGAPTDATDLGLSHDEVATAMQMAHYCRNRLTIVKIGGMLGIHWQDG